MKAKRTPCEHTCPRDCELLNLALRREEEIERYYIEILSQCERSDIRLYVREILVERKRLIENMEERINAMYTTFDPAGC